MKCSNDSKALSNTVAIPKPRLLRQLCQNCAKTCSLNHRCAGIQGHFIGLAVDFLQSLSLHVQLHLRVSFEDLRVPLAKQLCHPLIGNAARTEARGVCGPQVVNPKVGNLRSSKGLSPNGL